jgi:sec-independent protein translocase protein TatA
MGIGNPVHLIFIAAIALVVLGPKRLPELAKSLGNGMREFKDSLSEAVGQDDTTPQVPLAQLVAAEQPVVDPAAPLAAPAPVPVVSAPVAVPAEAEVVSAQPPHAA